MTDPAGDEGTSHYEPVGGGKGSKVTDQTPAEPQALSAEEEEEHEHRWVAPPLRGDHDYGIGPSGWWCPDCSETRDSPPPWSSNYIAALHRMPDWERHTDIDRWLATLDVLRAAVQESAGERHHPLDFPDHTHRWQERTQEALDSEYSETGAMLGRWHCPDCYEETDVQPDQLRESSGLDVERAAIIAAARLEDEVSRLRAELANCTAAYESVASRDADPGPALNAAIKRYESLYPEHVR